MSSSVEVEHIGHLDVDNSEEALVAFLEFALVKDLDGNDWETELGGEKEGSC
jgi:hypothetical protein